MKELMENLLAGVNTRDAPGKDGYIATDGLLYCRKCHLYIQMPSLPILSRIRDKTGYTETLIIPNPLNKTRSCTDLPEKIRDNILLLLLSSAIKVLIL